MDCGSKLETVSYVESCTKWHCKECNAHWFQSRTVRVEWIKQNIILDNPNISNSPVMSTQSSDRNLKESISKVKYELEKFRVAYLRSNEDSGYWTYILKRHKNNIYNELEMIERELKERS
jgi:hypothetical protein